MALETLATVLGQDLRASELELCVAERESGRVRMLETAEIEAGLQRLADRD